MSHIVEHKQKTITGLKWSGINQVIKQILTIVISILLARLLSPKEFGLLGMVTVITGFMQLFNDFGFGAALIQKKELDTKDLNSVFWFNLFVGTIFCLFLIIGSGVIANFYRDPAIKNVVIVISFIFIIQSLSYVQLTILKKEMNFVPILIAELSSIVISGIVALFLAYNGFGVMSLLVQIMINSLVCFIVLWHGSIWKPKLQFSLDRIKKLLQYSLPLMGSNVLGYFLGNLDKLLIGRFLGTNSLGIYSRAYSLMVFPVSQISGVISQVMFPSLAQIQDDRDRIRTIYLKLNRVVSFFTFPLMVIAFSVSGPFIIVVLGPQWEEMIPVFKILTFVGAIQSVGTLVGNIFMALGEMKVYLKMNFYSSLVFIACSLVGLKFGIVGVSIGLVVATFILAIPQWIITGKLINLTLINYLQPFKMNAICSILLLLSTFYIKYLFPVLNDNNLQSLLVITVVGIFLFFLFNFLFNRIIIKEIIQIGSKTKNNCINRILMWYKFRLL